MLSGQHFYYRTLRRNLIAFGTLFKNIQMFTYAANSISEISRINVPLTYAGKENFLTRLLANPDLHKPTQIVLPRMSFEMTNISYDSSRKLSPYLSNFTGGAGASVSQQYSGVPYNIDFELNIYVRNVEDGTQIVEQILPYFNPDYTVAMSFVDTMDITRDIPIILESVDYNPNYEGDAETTVRILTWTLKFKMKTYFFGPINAGGLITTATANTYTFNDLMTDVFTLYMNPGFGNNYLPGEVVYQGNNLPNSTTTATVVSWNYNTGDVASTLVITNKQGNDWKLTSNVIGSKSQASATISSLIPSVTLHVQRLVTTPNPANSNGSGDFGFTNTLYESPNL